MAGLCNPFCLIHRAAIIACMNNISKLQSTSSPRFHASLLLIAIFAIGLLALMPGCRQSAPDTLDVAAGNNPDQVANSVDGETIDVTVVIQANDSSREFKRTDIQSGATVEEVMRTIVKSTESRPLPQKAGSIRSMECTPSKASEAPNLTRLQRSPGPLVPTKASDLAVTESGTSGN